tara:strand:- start:1128 stop:2123 length:996 start_codon:yes stop_codon:yes gene_type:complete
MLGPETREDVTRDIPIMIEQFYTPAPYPRSVNEGEVLIAGVGGLGCIWALEAHSRCSELAELLLIDADESSFEGAHEANCLYLDAGGEGRGAAALPSMASHRLRNGIESILPLLEAAEILILLTGLGGGMGSGASGELAKIANQYGCMVLSIAGLPFAEQPLRCSIAEEAIPSLDINSSVCIRVSMERLAWQSRRRKTNWMTGSGWIAELVEGLVTTLASVGRINLDLMDMRAIINKKGNATLIVGTGTTDNPKSVVDMARNSPLNDIPVEGASGCMIQVEGGPDMTLANLTELTDSFVSSMDPNCQVIMGARVTDEMIGKLRLVAVVSGI